MLSCWAYEKEKDAASPDMIASAKTLMIFNLLIYNYIIPAVGKLPVQVVDFVKLPANV